MTRKPMRRGRRHLRGWEPRKNAVVTVDELAEIFELPPWEDVQENTWEYVADAGNYGYREAIEDDADEDDAEEAREKAEAEAQDEVYGQWYDGVTSAAEQLFEEHELDLIPKRKDKFSHEFEVAPREKGQKGWRKAAEAIRETINGVGYFRFESLQELLDSGPYTAREAVLSHLHVINDYPAVYGTTSAVRIYESALR